MLDEILRAAALVLVIEGVFPFLSPRRFRQSLVNMASVEDRWMRIIGALSMLAGLALLHLAS